MFIFSQVNVKMKLIIIIFSISLVFSKNIEYEYSEQCEWPEKFPECGGSHQSPIELNFKDATEFHDAPSLKFHSYSRIIPGDSWILTNTGHTMKLTICPHYDIQPKVEGGFLPGTFNLHNIHFHWGSKDTQGSEHVLNNKYFALEMHMVHWNDKYCSYEEARKFKDGLLAFGVLFKKADEIKFSSIFKIADAIENVLNFDNETHFDDGFSVGSLFPVKKCKYFTYQGSLTVPPCIEVITWIVFYQYLPISCGELREFRRIYDFNNEHVMDNFRKVQPIGDRVVGLIKN